MLRTDEASKRLEAFRIPDRHARLKATLAKLPEKIASVGYLLLGFDEKGKEINDYSLRQACESKLAERFARLGVKERGKLFETFHPKLARNLELGWQLRGRLPYQLGGARRAYHMPPDDSTAFASRLAWFRAVHAVLVPFEEDIHWVAAWAVHIASYGNADALGILLAAAVDDGDDEVFEILKASASNQHEIGSMGRHVTRGLMCSARPEAWEYAEKLLLAAQRQEGLRQVILETIDEAHPEAFKKMMRLILSENLLRFSSVVRAVDVWFGLQWSALTPAVLKKAVENALLFLEDRVAREKTIASADDESLFLALYANGFENALTAIAPAAKLAKDPRVERRFIAQYFLRDLALPQANAVMPTFLDDEDLRIAYRALWNCPSDVDLFDKIAALAARLPERPAEKPALVWPWATTMIDRSTAADKLVEHLGKRPPTVLVPYISQMGYWGKRQALEKLKNQKKWDDATRDTFFAMIGDRDYYVRGEALKALENCTVDEARALQLEGYLSRKQSDLRRAVFTLLRQQKRPAVFASIDRLLAKKKPAERQGGLELMRQLVENNEAVKECQARLETYLTKYTNHTPFDLARIETIRDAGKPKPTLDNALGLMDPGARTKPITPKMRKTACFTKAARDGLLALDALIDANRETSVKLESYGGGVSMLLGNLQYYHFPTPQFSEPLEKDLERLPLRELWTKWLAERAPKLRDKDGCEVLRMLANCGKTEAYWKERREKCGDQWNPYFDYITGGLTFPELKYAGMINRLLLWLLRIEMPANAAKFTLETLESAFSLIPHSALTFVPNPQGNYWEEQQKDWRGYYGPVDWYSQCVNFHAYTKATWTPEDEGRWWQLLHWRDQPIPGVARHRPDLEPLLHARAVNLANETDLYDQLLGPNNSFAELRTLTADPKHKWFDQDPALRDIVDRCRDRIIEIELARGENPTAASSAAHCISQVHGLERLMQFIAVLGDRKLKESYSGTGRAEVLTHLIQVTQPKPEDTPEAFKAQARQAKLSNDFLLNLGFLAPQWLPHVEATLGWPGLREAAWWLFGFTGGSTAHAAKACDEERLAGLNLNDRWAKMLAERTKLTDTERGEGMVDVEWFRRVYEPLGKKKWEAIGEAAKARIGAKKALYAADVILGKVKKADLVTRIKEKQAREAVRLLGLLPLARGEKQEADVQGRYKVLLGYRKHAKSLSPMGREGAMRDLQIGLANLAATAGYPDPIRLEWALEARELADLAAGPITLTHDGVSVTLRLDESNQPEVTQKRGDKPLKAIPPAVRKNPRITDLLERSREIKRQASRIKQSLETMMNRGDEFTGKELRQLSGHALLAPLLARLVIIGEGIKGYPVAQGQALEDHTGKREPVKPDEKLRIAHPHDLYSGGDWDRWQAHCFAVERVQPFKQVFRELYLITEGEREDGHLSKRYAGQQVNPNQAMALFGSRTWNTREEISKTFHEAGIVAEVDYRNFAGTPGEVEGATFHTVMFRKRDDWKPIPLAEVPPRIFSEVMRDCDLVVSVAHVGGVDPEASASTVQMRLSLVRETCALLGIDNWRLKEPHHLLIDGKLGSYSLHMGSGIVHKMPGGSVCIVPVHSQHRGRLFLPFADDDPRTAEIISKVLLLTRDDQIQDPNILDQLR